MKPVTLSVNLTEAVEDLQLGLTKEQIEYIANDIKRGWDFSHIYEEIEVKVEESIVKIGVSCTRTNHRKTWYLSYTRKPQKTMFQQHCECIVKTTKMLNFEVKVEESIVKIGGSRTCTEAAKN